MKNTKVTADRNSKAVALKVNNGKGGFYRYTAEEVEKMKSSILSFTEDDGSAWRDRITLEGEAYCCKCSEAEKAKRVRKIALYHALTDHHDMPNWLQDSEPQEEHFARINEADGSIIPDGEPIKEDHGYAIPHYTDNETAAEVCTLKVQIYKDNESFPGREITEFGANGRRLARVGSDAYNVGKWCAAMAHDLTKQWRNASYQEAVNFVCREIENDLRKYGIKVEFVEQ